MHVLVSELVGESPDGWKSAVQAAISEASKSVDNIVGVEIINLTANVENGHLNPDKVFRITNFDFFLRTGYYSCPSRNHSRRSRKTPLSCKFTGLLNAAYFMVFRHFIIIQGY
jgi:flavin-binding protein dodecin